MPLKTYGEKRNLEISKEPPAKLSKKHSTRIFTIQKHAASHLHYDFRLEVNGVLKSWAVPKGPSLNPKDKRLALMVEDHPYDYKDFEGIIPKGNYGAGTVMVWDNGVYEVLDNEGNPADDDYIDQKILQGEISFILKGDKLKGEFTLVQLKNDPSHKNWLLIKKKDKYASQEDILEKDRSVKSGKNMEEIAGKNSPPLKQSSTKSEKRTKDTLQKIDLDQAPLQKMPTKIKPMLCTLVDQPFDSDEWLFEIKWDGFRAIAELKDQDIYLYSRNFLSFNDRFPTIVNALKELKIEAIFDGEIVALNKKGGSDFQSLQNYSKEEEENIYYQIFDILYYGGHDLRELPLIQRKEILEKILSKTHSAHIQYSDHILSKGKVLFTRVKKEKLEGIVGKKIQSHYTSTRSREWLKIKTHERQEAIICGFTSPKGSRNHFGSLILGVYEDKHLRYVGHVGTGFNHSSLADIYSQLSPLITKKCPFATPPETDRTVTWIKPKLVCEISFAEWTSSNNMRQPVFLGLRPDKNPIEVKKEDMTPIKKIAKKKKSTLETSHSFTNLDKVFWPTEGYTKGDLIEYYTKIQPYILPYLKDRPESLRRYPNGIDAEGFFQKNMGKSLPEWIESIDIPHHGESVKYMLIQDERSLLYAVNLGCIDFNPFSARIVDLNKPDYLVLDLDPENIPFSEVIQTAQVIHEILDGLKIPNYCKTSGSRGLHIYVPLQARYDYEDVKNFAHLIAQMTHERLPKITSLERSPQNRQKKVYIDYLQNNPGQTVVAPYSIRAKPGAPVSTPLSWSEVKIGLDPKEFTIKSIFKRLKNKDIFLPVLGKGINLEKSLRTIQTLL